MVWQLIMLAVVTLTVLKIALVQTTKHDDIVGCLGFLYGFGYHEPGSYPMYRHLSE